MHTHYLVTLNTQDLDVANEHFYAHDKDINIHSATRGQFDYAKSFCMLGDSFVSISRSRSGWGYETRNEADGFLISIPQAGTVTWRSLYGSVQVKAGQVGLADQREVNRASYEAGVKYITVYIANVDMFRALSMLLGHPPKTRVFFKDPRGPHGAGPFISNIVTSIVSYSHSTSAPIKGVTRGLKESLIAYVLYTFENNYSRTLHDARSVPLPTPYAIKQAVQHMVNCLDNDLTVNEIALKVGISTRSLQLGFKRFKNMTPMEFLRVTRLQRAREMLTDPTCEKTPKEVAIACGFTNIQLYNRYYTEAYGERPSDTADARMK